MPFDRCFPRSFTEVSVRAHAPSSSGLYGVTNAREWIFIGQSDNIQAALLNHLRDIGSDVMTQKPTGFVCETCDPNGCRQRVNRLVQEYEPVCNRLSRGRLRG